MFGDLRQTYAGLDTVVNRMANALTARGVEQGDRVAMLGHNHHAYVVTWLALARLGVVSVPINFMLKADEVAYVLSHAGATGIIAEDALTGVADSAIAELPEPGIVRLRGVIGLHELHQHAVAILHRPQVNRIARPCQPNGLSDRLQRPRHPVTSVNA